MKIYFVRHGKTEWNLERRLQGQSGDSPLLAESILEIQKVAEHLKNIHFDRIISSPQPRAMKTCQLLTAQDFETDARLVEWNFGQLEGVLIADALEKYPAEMYASRNHLDQFDGSDFEAESVESVLSRFTSLAEELKVSSDENSSENILLVGHGSSGTAGLRHLAGFKVSELREAGGILNNSINILEFADGAFKMKVWNQEI